MVNPVAEAVPTAERDKLNREAGLLVGSVCRECRTVSWPARAVCQRCAGETDVTHRLSATGTLLSFTRVWVARPGVDAPYWLGQAEIDGCVFFGHVRGLDEMSTVPCEVRVEVGDTEQTPLFWFEPVGS